jgi:hypothetical protein
VRHEHYEAAMAMDAAGPLTAWRSQ